jgi:hypothetical protein
LLVEVVVDHLLQAVLVGAVLEGCCLVPLRSTLELHIQLLSVLAVLAVRLVQVEAMV